MIRPLLRVLKWFFEETNSPLYNIGVNTIPAVSQFLRWKFCIFFGGKTVSTIAESPYLYCVNYLSHHLSSSSLFVLRFYLLSLLHDISPLNYLSSFVSLFHLYHPFYLYHLLCLYLLSSEKSGWQHQKSVVTFKKLLHGTQNKC